MNLPFPTDTRFLEIMREQQAAEAEMKVDRSVLVRGPFWPSCWGPGFKFSVKNRFNDVLAWNLTEEQATEVAQLLNDLERN